MNSVKYLISILTFILGSLSYADIVEDFDTLGGDNVLLERARALQPDRSVMAVQNRAVSRHYRHEFAPEYTSVVGGDTFLDTTMLGLKYHFHINPRFSLGAHYFKAYNELSAEGKTLIAEDKLIPDVDYPKGGYEAILAWYPIYGKFSLYDLGIVHFDVYALGSYGDIELSSGKTSLYSYGGGIAFWLTQHITTRFEIQQKHFQAVRQSGNADMKLTSGSFSLGLLL